MRFQSITLLLALSFVIGLCTSSTDVLALEELTVADMQRQAADLLRARCKRHLAIRIDQLKRDCALSDPQVKKLQVAAKGAVEKSMESREGQANLIQFGGRRVAVGGIPRAALIGSGQWPLGFQSQVELAKVVDEPIWKKTLDRVLTDEQKRIDRESQDKRRAYLRKTSVQDDALDDFKSAAGAPDRQEQLIINGGRILRLP